MAIPTPNTWSRAEYFYGWKLAVREGFGVGELELGEGGGGVGTEPEVG